MTTPVTVPQFTDSVDLRSFIEPLNAPTNVLDLLGRFPDSLYAKTPDSHFVRFMTALLGPVGVGWLAFNLTVARLQLEGTGLQQSDLESFYGDPFSFGRILTETFEDDLAGVLPLGVWQKIYAQDQAYRSRAIQFLHAARFGTNPRGMQLAATSGVGQAVEIIENYRYLFDQHSDSRLNLPSFGQTNWLGEFIVVPRATTSRTQQQIIQFTQASPGLSPYTVSFNGATVALDPTTTGSAGAGQTPGDIETALWGMATIGPGNVYVSGGPVPADVTVTFTGLLSNQDLPTLQVTDVAGTVPVAVVTGAIDPSTETVGIADVDRHSMQVALDKLRPVASFPTFDSAVSTLSTQLWSSVASSSDRYSVLRYVTGSPSVPWPTVDSDHWIVASQETEAPQLSVDLSQHYVNFHNVLSLTPYSDTALADPLYASSTAILDRYTSVHVGPFPEMSGLMPFFAQYRTSYGLVFNANRGLADYTEPLTVAGLSAGGTAFINGIYPADYTGLQGVPALRYHDDAFWASLERASGAEILEIDLGTPQAVNFIAFEITRKPVDIEIDYDLLDQSPGRTFTQVILDPNFPNQTQVYFDPTQQNPWEGVQFLFNDGQDLIFTRFIRLIFTRRADSTTYGRFLFDTATQIQTPWSIDLRNLRVGRNIAPAVT